MGKSKRVLITGAGGFIGSHVVEAFLKSGAQITALVHYNSRDSYGNLELLGKEVLKNIKIVSGDITDNAQVRKITKGHDVIIHLAALIGIPYSFSSVESYIRTNIQGTFNLLDAAKENGVERFIATSTSEVYGTVKNTSITETHPLHPQSPYAASKVGSDKMAESFYHAFNLPVVILRPFNNYGPRQSTRAIIPTVITQALSGKSIKVGDTSTVRDFLYVKDCAQAFLKAADQKGILGETINIGTGKGILISQMIKKVQKIIGKNITVVPDQQRIRPNTSEVKKLVCDNKKAKKLLGWQPQTNFEDGLTETIEWFKNNMGLYKVGKYSQ